MELKHYQIYPVKQLDYIAICFSVSYERPDFSEMNIHLRKLGQKGFFLLDLRGCNGESYNNRFFRVYFNGDESNINSLKKLKESDLNSSIIKICNRFYLKIDPRAMV